jgi:hypothetical protein
VRSKSKARLKPAVSRPEEALRRLPIHDPSIVRVDETAFVLAASGLEPVTNRDGGISATEVAVGLWLGLAGALLLIACATPLVAVAPRLNEWRGQLALVGTNMVVAAVVGYLVVAVTS